ncbi:hypothetical protein vseg_003519 [Gypsophila vaccaria]
MWSQHIPVALNPPTSAHCKRYAKSNKGKLTSAAEIFLDTHTKPGPDGEKRFQKKKDAAIYDAYLLGVEDNPNQKSENEI